MSKAGVLWKWRLSDPGIFTAMSNEGCLSRTGWGASMGVDEGKGAPPL